MKPILIILIGLLSQTFSTQDKTNYDTLQFEKIIFHTSACYGTCPIYHLEIDKDKTVKLYAERVYILNEIDRSKVGYFKGILDENTFNELITSIKACHVDSLKSKEVVLLDAPSKTIIVFYNGKRKYLKSSVFPPEANNLISKLYHICKYNDFQQTEEKFKIEQ